MKLNNQISPNLIYRRAKQFRAKRPLSKPLCSMHVCRKMQEIVLRYCNMLGFKELTHARTYYHSLQRFVVTTDSDYATYYIENELHKKQHLIYPEPDQFFSLERLKNHPVYGYEECILSPGNQLKRGNNVIFAKYRENYVDLYTFTGQYGDEFFSEKLFNNHANIERFISYYHFNSNEINQEAMIYLHSIVETYPGVLDNEEVINNAKCLILEQPQRINLNAIGLDIYLTRSEARLLTQLDEHSAIKVIAKQLKVSPKTVEYHLQNIRQKLNLQSKKAVIEFIKTQPLLAKYLAEFKI